MGNAAMFHPAIAGAHARLSIEGGNAQQLYSVDYLDLLPILLCSAAMSLPVRAKAFHYRAAIYWPDRAKAFLSGRPSIGRFALKRTFSFYI